jgi:hypothetical protein
VGLKGELITAFVPNLFFVVVLPYKMRADFMVENTLNTIGSVRDRQANDDLRISEERYPASVILVGMDHTRWGNCVCRELKGYQFADVEFVDVLLKTFLNLFLSHQRATLLLTEIDLAAELSQTALDDLDGHARVFLVWNGHELVFLSLQHLFTRFCVFAYSNYGLYTPFKAKKRSFSDSKLRGLSSFITIFLT